jgi:hypothetical protein
MTIKSTLPAPASGAGSRLRACDSARACRLSEMKAIAPVMAVITIRL